MCDEDYDTRDILTGKLMAFKMAAPMQVSICKIQLSVLRLYDTQASAVWREVYPKIDDCKRLNPPYAYISLLRGDLLGNHVGCLLYGADLLSSC